MDELIISRGVGWGVGYWVWGAAKGPPGGGRALGRRRRRDPNERGSRCRAYLGGAGVNPSRLRPGSGLGLGFGAFLTSFLPLSLLPMGRSVTHDRAQGLGYGVWDLGALVRGAGEDEVGSAAGFVVVAGHDDGAVVGCGLAVDEALGVEGLGTATAVGDEFGEVSGVGADEPG